MSDKYDLIIGWKKNRLDPLEKRIASKIFNFFIRVFSGLKIKDSNTGIKIFKREVAESLNLYGGRHRYIPLLAHQKNFRVAEVAVNHRKRKFGESKYGSERYKHGFLRFFNNFIFRKVYGQATSFFWNDWFFNNLSRYISRILCFISKVLFTTLISAAYCHDNFWQFINNYRCSTFYFWFNWRNNC